MSEHWWKRQLPSLRQLLVGDLRRKFPALRDRHEDLVHDTLVGVTERVAADESALPPSWFGEGAPESEEERTHLTRLARTILRRRVADLFRGRVRDWGDGVSSAEELVDRSEPVDKALGALDLVRATAAAMAELSDADRDALLLAAERDGERVEGRMPDKDRQRLSRARQRLAQKLRERLGDAVDALLRGDE